MKRSTLIASIVVFVMVACATCGLIAFFVQTVAAVENSGYYLFCYFVGNDPNEERVHLAVSTDGYDYVPLNNNNEIILQQLGTKSVRDPYIFRTNDKYYIIGTDMRSDAGWNSNHCMVIWESSDLVNWGNERIIDMHDYDATNSADRVWAPEVIYDEVENSYMIYWSNHNSQGSDSSTVIWYAYTDDFVSLKTEPKVLFRPSTGLDAIDADIIYNDGIYYMYYKDECNSTIMYATSSSLTGPYVEPEKGKVSTTNRGVEGTCIYKLTGTNTYVMIMDKYSTHDYYMQQTTDFINFKPVRFYDYDLDFSPRHGSVITISKEEYDILITATWQV